MQFGGVWMREGTKIQEPNAENVTFVFLDLLSFFQAQAKASAFQSFLCATGNIDREII
jgi:hypothetical protein